MENTTTISTGSRYLAEAISSDMTSAVLPVTIVVGIEASMAFFGNLLILYVFVFKYHSCNFKYFVLCLSMIDITSSLTTLPGEIFTQTQYYVYPYPMICKIKSFFNVFTVMASALCLLVIAVDRFRKVCRPFGWQIKTRTAMVLCLVILFISTVVAFPVTIFWGTHDANVTYKGESVIVTVCEIDQAYVHTHVPLAYTVIISGTIGITLVSMLVLYVFIVKALFKRKSPKHDVQPTERGNEPLPHSNVLLEMPNLVHVDSSSAIEYAHSNADEFTTRSMTETSDENKKQTTHKPQCKRYRATTTTERNAIVRRKTIIMLVLTSVFIITTFLYLTLLSCIAMDVLYNMSNSGKAVYFFFLRLYFINHAVNPWVYGFLDPQFRKVIKTCKTSLKAVVSFASGEGSN